jgi:hypothetical protein
MESLHQELYKREVQVVRIFLRRINLQIDTSPTQEIITLPYLMNQSKSLQEKEMPA